MPSQGDIVKPVDMGGPPIFKNKLLRFRETTTTASFSPSTAPPHAASNIASFDPRMTMSTKQPLSPAQQEFLDVAMRESGVAPAHVVLRHSAPVPSTQQRSTLQRLRSGVSASSSSSSSSSPAPPLHHHTESMEHQLERREAMMLSLSRMAAAGEQPSPRASSLLETKLSHQSGTCQTITIDLCFGNAPYSASLNVPELSSMSKAKKGIKQVFQLLPMAFSLLGGAGEEQVKIKDKLPEIASMLCSALLPPCTSSCEPQKSCLGGCVNIQKKVLNDDIRGQLQMVSPDGPMRSVIESMVHGPALVVLDRALAILRDDTCAKGGNFDADPATCGDLSQFLFEGGVCVANGGAPTSEEAPAAPVSASAAPVAPDAATLEKEKEDSETPSPPLTGTQVVMANIVENTADQAKSEIASMIPLIEGEIMKQEHELEVKLNKAEKSLVNNVNLTVAGERTNNILKNGANDTMQFVLNETHKLKLLDAAYTACEKYKDRVEIARLFSAVEMATDPETKHDLLIRLEIECEELDHPSSFPVKNKTVIVEKVSNTTNTTNVTAPVAATPVVVAEEEVVEVPRSVEEQVAEMESKLEASSDIEDPYSKKDNNEIKDLFDQFPRGSREKYSKEQYKWMKEAKAGSAAVRQFAQWQPRYTHEEANHILGNGNVSDVEKN